MNIRRGDGQKRRIYRHARLCGTYIVQSLNHPGIGTKKYWSILQRFLGKHKLLRLPPIQHNSFRATDVSEKATMFNTFFAKQCTLIQTGSVSPDFQFLTNNRLDRANFDTTKILSIIIHLMGIKLMVGMKYLYG